MEAGVLSALIHVTKAVSGFYLLAPYYLSRGQLWRMTGDRSLAWLPMVYLFLGVVLALAYRQVGASLGRGAWRRGLRFGLWVWLIVSIPFHTVQYVLMPIPGALVAGEGLGDLIAFLASGLIFARLIPPRPVDAAAGSA